MLINKVLFKEFKKIILIKLIVLYLILKSIEHVIGLYPSKMKYYLFPIGDFVKFEGDISILNENYYRIGDVDVETKKDQYQPYLQIHSLTKGAAIVICSVFNTNKYRTFEQRTNEQ